MLPFSSVYYVCHLHERITALGRLQQSSLHLDSGIPMWSDQPWKLIQSNLGSIFSSYFTTKKNQEGD